MDSIRVQASGATMPDYKINHPTESPFRKYNIQFHAGTDGNHRYLRDFSQAGIERFVEENQPKGKALNAYEVKIFLQAVAHDPEKFKDMVIDLSDPDLGLRQGDHIQAGYFQEDFTLKFDKKSYNKGASQTQVAFIDVKGGEFDKKITDDIQSDISKANKSVREAYAEQKKIAEKIGDNAYRELEKIENELEEIEPSLTQTKADLAKYQEELKGLERTSEQARELRRQITGTKLEISDLEKRQSELRSELNKDRSGFFESKASYADLQRAQKKVKKHQAELDAAEARLYEHQHPQPKEVPQQPTVPTEKATSDKTNPAKATVDTAAFLEKNSRGRLGLLYGAQPETQKSYISSVTKAEDVQALLDETNKIIAANKSSLASVDAQSEQRIAAYEAIRQQLLTRQSELSTPQTPGQVPAQTEGTASSKKDPANTAPVDPTKQTGQTVGNAPTKTVDETKTDMKVPEQKGSVADTTPVVDTAAFKALNAKAQFDMLMTAEASALEPLLRSLSKTERDAIAAHAQQLIKGYIAQYGSSLTQVTTTSTSAAGSTGATGGTASGTKSTSEQTTTQTTVSAEVRAQYTRANLILELITKINAEEAGTQPKVPDQTPVPTASVNETPQGYEYSFTGHKTAREIARELAKGNELATTDFIKQIVANPAYQQLLNQAGDPSKWPDADLNPSGQLMKIVLSRSVSSEDSRNAVVNAGRKGNTTAGKTPPPKKTE